MRVKAAWFIALTLVSAACAGSSDDGAGSTTLAIEPVSNASAAPAEGPATTAAAPPAVTPTGTQPPAAANDGRTTAEILADVEADPTATSLDAAFVEYAAMFEPLPGTSAVPQDGTIYTSPTHVFQTIEFHRDELTNAQAAAFDAKVAELDSIEPLEAFALDPDATDGDSDTEPTGFAGRGFRSVAAPASDELRRELIALGLRIRQQLGGEVLLIWVEIVPDGSLGVNVGAKATGLGPISLKRAELAERGILADCVVQLTDSVVTAGVLETDSDALGIVTHEVFHCWQFGQLGWDPSVIGPMDDWAKEGMAAFFGEQFGGITRFNVEWWDGYLNSQVQTDGSWPLYTSSYAAIGFWAQIHAGPDYVAAMKRTLAAAPGNDAMYQAALSGMGAGTAWLAAGAMQEGRWGPGWTASGPGMPGTPRTNFTDTVSLLDGVYTASVGPARHRNMILSVDAIDGAIGTVMKTVIDGTGVMRVENQDIVANGEFVANDWCLGNCACPDGTPTFGADRTLPENTLVAASLVGLAGVGSTALVELEVFNADEYDCESPDVGDPIPGLIGTWRANPGAVARMYEEASAFGDGATPLDVAGTTGDVFMRFDEDGTGQLQYQEVSVVFNDAPIDLVTINGSGSFRWGVVNGELLIDGLEFSYGVTTPALGAEPLIITHLDVPSVGVTKLSGQALGNTMTITASEGSAGAVFFPVSWVRQ